jgi:hypothetical protein
MSKQVVSTSAFKVALGVAIFATLRALMRGSRRLGWRWRRVLTPLWVGGGVWLLAVLVRINWSGWWWLALTLPVLGAVLAVLGPRLGDRVRTVVMRVVPEGLDRGSNGVLDRPTERTFLAVLLGWVGTYLAVRIGTGPTPLTGALWQIGVLGLGGTWWWHRRVRVAGKADRYARKWGKITRGETKALELRALQDSKPVKVISAGAIARLRIRLGEGVTPAQVTRATDALASYFNLRPGAVFASNDEDSGRHVWFSFLPKDPWKGKITHPMPRPASTTLVALNFRFVMGMLADASELKFKLQHALIVGQSGSGKSVWLESLLIWLLACRDVVIVGIDMAGGATLGMWRRILALPLATDLDSAKWTLERVLAVIEVRERQLGLDKEESDDAGDEFQPSPDRPWVVLVVDEHPDLVAAGDKEVVRLIGRIGKRARKCGVRILPLAQNGSKDDVGSKEFQAQLRAVVGLGLDPHASKVLWGELVRQGWNSSGLRNGQFLLRDDEHPAPAIAKGFFVSPRDRRQVITDAVEIGRPVLEPTAWAALTGTEGIVIDMPAEKAAPVDEILQVLRDEGARTVDELVALPGMPSRATVFRRLKNHKETGLAHSVNGVWHYGSGVSVEPVST